MLDAMQCAVGNRGRLSFVPQRQFGYEFIVWFDLMQYAKCVVVTGYLLGPEPIEEQVKRNANWIIVTTFNQLFVVDCCWWTFSLVFLFFSSFAFSLVCLAFALYANTQFKIRFSSVRTLTVIFIVAPSNARGVNIDTIWFRFALSHWHFCIINRAYASRVYEMTGDGCDLYSRARIDIIYN